MDFKQKKLTKSEWNSIEIQVSPQEKEVLKLIKDGYHNVNIKINKTESLFTFLKIDFSASLEDYLYVKYFADKIKYFVEHYSINYIHISNDKKSVAVQPESYVINVANIVKLKSADQVRVSRFNSISEDDTSKIYEYILLHHLEQILKLFKRNNATWMHNYYTLVKLLQNNVSNVIRYIKGVCQIVLEKLEPHLNLLYIFANANKIIEKNKNLLKYGDMHLYTHQKDIFTVMKSSTPKLVLYIAPTGTGKTLTPIGLSEQKRVIFVCAARHVGLALARSAISIGKKIAFAFGCNTSDDVKLHYFAVTKCARDKKSGQIRKVDNSANEKVEMIICDIRSYIPAMCYMLSSNEPSNMVTYWDEPTISMDYETHDLHRIIRKNWRENVIPNVVLSSATLPKLDEIQHTINDFKQKFTTEDGIIPEIVNIVSHDCRKTIALVDNDGYVSMPHYLSDNYDEILKIVQQCEENLTLMRYIDLHEASSFCLYVIDNNYAKSSCAFDRNFASINDIDMTSIKLYYLKVLKNIRPSNWPVVYNHFMATKMQKICVNQTVDTKGNSLSKKLSKKASIGFIPTNTDTITTSDTQLGNIGMYVTTKDAYTLTDGPTIFLAKDLSKVARLCIQQANIPVSIMQDIQDKLQYNAQLNERIVDLEKQIEGEESKIMDKMSAGVNEMSSKKQQSGAKMSKAGTKTETRQMRQLVEDVNTLKMMIKPASLDDLLIPNKPTHLNKWAEGLDTTKSFTSNIDDDTVTSIMLLKDIEDSWKILLLLGIGVFTQHRSIGYSEIMKNLADMQKLYLIIADTDYIYGTNYQFCHGYLGKDLNLTQEKIIQSLGRIGRNNIQQEYTARFRDKSQINLLFKHLRFEEKPEAINMNVLFNSRTIMWNAETGEFDELNSDEESVESEYQDQDQDEECDEDEMLKGSNNTTIENELKDDSIDDEN